MPRILLAECKQEVSSFNPVLSHYEDFSVSRGVEILDLHRGGKLEMAGALSVFDRHEEIELVPTYSARARTSTGTLATADFECIADEFLSAVRASSPVDGAYFSLHGAMASVNEDDPEGYLLAEARKILGEAIAIIVSLDLHAVLTERMLEHADAIVVFHTYPHNDFFETGVRAATLLLRVLSGEVRPVTARVRIPALVRGDELKTETGLLGGFIRDAQAIEQGEGGLSAAMIIGNPFTDVPALSSNSLVVTNDDPVRAKEEAVRLARGFWEVRERLQAPLVSIPEAIQMAAHTGGTVVFTDAADATSSGATGDSNAILRGLLDAGYSGRALIPIVDPQAVVTAVAGGVGAEVRVALGGALDPGRFEPVEVEARVRMLGDGRYASEYSGIMTDGGPTAVLQSGNITLVVTSRSVNLMDRSLFLAYGQDPRQFDLVVVKSPHTRYDFFEAWAACLLNVDAPGSTSANLRSLGHVKCDRPIFPLDEGVRFVPHATIHRRP